ncbi:MAG: T9SS type A sorting domain-containing protein [Bacteroidales bacterium]|nr:T9SS type A sorting domain-containing protein [Bacteroidales bacterium]MCF8456137.1 T9SS type A sorting domain-containing protein [Bacteroidales bacterium]
MKTILKSTLTFFVAAFFIVATASFVNAQPGSITAPSGTSMNPSGYVDTTLADDPVFIFCTPDTSGNTLLGSLLVDGGTASCHFLWMVYNPTINIFQNYGIIQTGASSSINNLQSGFYQVKITQNPGMPSQTLFYRRAHVFVNETEVDFNAISPGCQAFTLTGAMLDAGSNFVINDPPPSIVSHTITNEVTGAWSCFPIPWDTAWGSQDYNLNPNPVIDPPPLQSTTFCLTAIDHLYDTSGVEISTGSYPQYLACEPQVCHFFETLPTDGSIVYYPDTICQDSPPVQLIPLYYSGSWNSSLGFWPNGPITSNGWFHPSLAPLGNINISYSFGGICTDSDTVMITVVDPPVVSNVQEFFNSTNTHFQVQLTITGGSAATYQVLNCINGSIALGNFVDSIWISDSLPFPSSYCFIVSDASVCSPIYIQGSTFSNCTSSAGIMPSTPQEVCANDQTNVQVMNGPLGNPTYTLDANDGFEYFLHDNDFAFLGNIYDHNTTGIFQFLPSMAYGQTYYISQVVGNNIGTSLNNIVDLSDTCLSVSVGTPVIWTEQPSPNAGPDDSVCGLTIQLNADSANQGIGFWSCLTYYGVIYTPHSFDAQATVTVPYFDTNQFGDLINTDYIFRWTIENGPCQVYDEVTITFMPIHDATIISYPTIICKNSPPVQLIPLNSGGVWSGSLTWPPGPVTSTGLFYPSQAWLGNNTVTYSFSGVCPDSETIIINVVDAPQVWNIQHICDITNYTQYQVSFTIVGGNPGAYLFLNSADSLPFSGNLNGTTWTSDWLPNPSSYSFFVTDNNNCNPTFLSSYYTCDPATQAGNMPTTIQELCEYEQVNVQVLNDPFGNPSYILDPNDCFEYYLHDNQFGNLGNVVSHNTTGIFQFGVTMVYGQTYYVSNVVGNNIGTSANPLVDISHPITSVSPGTPVIWYQFPTASAGQKDSICGLTFQLDADTATVGMGSWTVLSATGAIFNPNFNDPQAIVTIPYFDTNQYGCLMNTNHVFRWTVTNGPCETFDDVTITFKPIPEAFAGNDFTICGLSAETSAQWSNLCGPIGSSTGEWFGPGVAIDYSSPLTYVNMFAPGITNWIWRESNGECVDEDTVSITFLEQPMVDANYNDSVCGNSYNLNAISTMGIGWWEGPFGSVFSNPTLPQSAVQINFYSLSEVEATFTWNEQNSICTASDSVSIVFSKIPTANAGLDDWTCGTQYNLNADILGSEYAEGTWSSGIPGTNFPDYHDPNTSAVIPNTGSFPGQPISGIFGDSSHVQVPIIWSMDNNHCVDVDIVQITYYQIPNAHAGPDSIICGTVYEMKAIITIGASTGKWTVVNGPTLSASWTDDTDPNAIVQVPSYGEYTFKWREKNLYNQTCATEDLLVIHFSGIAAIANSSPSNNLSVPNGEIDLLVTGGLSPYSFVWSNGATTEDIFNLDVGLYTVSVTDAYGCASVDSFEVTFNIVPTSPSWTYINTGNSHSISIQDTVPVTIDGVQISVGDYLGVFYDSLGTLACAGYVEWTGQTTTLTAWGNNAQTPQPDGFVFNEIFKWKIWRANNGDIFDVTATYIQPPAVPNNGHYINNGLSGLLWLGANSVEFQYVNLPQGWSFFSTYIDPFDANIGSLCAPFSSDVIIAKDGDGNTYWPQWGINSIGDILIGDGYQIKLSSAQTMTVSGLAVVPEITPILINQGWSFLGYLRKSSAPIASILSPIEWDVNIVKNGNGQIYWHLWNINQIGNMMPGQGYQINMISQQTLTYPSNSSTFTKSDLQARQPVHFPKAKNTGNSMTLGIPTSDLKLGSEIATFNQSGLLIGSAVVEGDFAAITLWGDDETTPEIDGLLNDEEFILKIWDGEESILKIVSWKEGEGNYAINNISIADEIVHSPIVDNQSYILYQNSPNPYANETNISFYLPRDCRVEMEIYNLLGKQVAELISEEMTQGKHGITFNSKKLPVGTYYYRLKTGEFEQTRKMVLIK